MAQSREVAVSMGLVQIQLEEAEVASESAPDRGLPYHARAGMFHIWRRLGYS